MGLGGGPPLSLNQDFGIQDMWSPATPVKNIPTRSPIIPKPSHGLPNQSSGPSWLDMVTGVQATTPWGLAFQNDACSSLALSTRLQDLNGSPEVAEVSTSQAAIGCAVPRPSITNRHNADALNHWSPKLGATALNAGNNNMPPLAPCFMQNGNFQVMPESSNQHLLNGKVLLPHGWCNDSSINWSISMTQYGSAGTFLPNLNSFPEAAMRFSGTENYSQRMQDKNQYLELAREGSFLVNELHAEASFSNLVASSDYSSIQNPGCAKDLAVRSDEASYQELEIEKSLAERENEGLELNDTSKQKPRRKKHRPKVIIEGKSVRTPKPGTPKPKTPKLAQDKENALVKRKYTHKKKDTSFSETNELGEIVESKSMSEVKSVRRGLNFDLEDSQTTDKFSVLMSMFMNNIENDEQEACKDGNLMSSRLKETADSTEVHGPVRENTLEGTVFDLKRTIIGPQNDYLKIIQTPLWSDTVSQNVETSKNNVSSNCVSDVPRGKKRDQHLTCEALELEKEYLMHSYNAGNCANKSHDLNRRGACLPYNNKKMRKETGPSEASMHTPSKFTYTPTGWETVQASNYTQDFTFTDSMKFISQDKLHTLESRLLCEEADVNKHSYQTLSNMSSLPGLIDYNRSPVPIKPSWPRNNNISQPPTPDKPSEYSNSQESKICGTLLKFDTSEDVNKPMKAKVKRGRKRKEENLLVNSLHSTSSNGASARNGEYLHHEIISFNCQDTKNRKASINSTFPLSPHMDFVDYLVRKLRQLNLNSGYEVASSQAQNAIVPYVSNGGMMVPFEGPFELAKRRRLRAKVDLDPETNRVWKLLMGIEGGDVGEKVDKEKWWEEERLVFRGRVDSFIARMHLVQGDRRFSQWKGSVVDSVIGVFLTQNVSDHLSSSAYMSLAAKFPLRPGRVYVAPNTEEAKIPLEEHNKPITTFIDTPYSKQNILDDISYSQGCSDLNATKNEGKKEVSSSSETPRSGSGCSNIACCTGIIETHEAELNFGHESPNSGSITGVTVTRSISSVEIEDRRLAEEVVSSQTSVISSQSSTGHQVPSNDYIRPSLLLNLETDDLLGGRTNNSFGCSSFTELLHIAESSKFQELYSHGSMSSTNGIHKIENGFPVLDQIDNVNPHHTPYGLSDILPESRFFYSLSPNFTILESNAGAVPEEIRSSLDCNKFEVNNGECSESAAENLVASDGLNKLLLTPGSTSTIDSYSPITTQHKASSTFSETEVCIDHQSFAHKNFGEKTQHKESSTFSETEVCIDHQSFTHTNFGEKTAASSNIEIWKDCIQAEDMKRLQQKNELSPFKAETSQDATKVPSQMEKSPKNSSVSNRKVQNKLDMDQKVGSNAKDGVNNFHKVLTDTPKQVEKAKKKADNEKIKFDWDSLRKEVNQNKPTRERSSGTMDSIDWEAVRCADVSEISETIRERGMNNMLAERIKDFLNRLVREHGSIDLEWLRDVPPDKSKDYLLSIRGLGLKSAECVRLLTLHHLAFPVDTNVGRICVRLGWVPLQPLPESLQLHLLELYPVLETIQKYLWPRLCKLDQRTLYELHYQMITFGKVFCTKSKPNCNACPMRGECRHFASAFASARLALPPPEDKSIVSSAYPIASECEVAPALTSSSIPKLECSTVSHDLTIQNCEPIIEEPATPEPECHESLESAIEDAFFQDLDEIPTIKLNFEKFTQNLQNYMQENMELQEGDMSKALVALTPEAASIPMPKLKNISRLRTEHQVYEIPDSHRLLEGLDRREPDDPCPYLLAIWTPGETAQSIEPPKDCCNSHDTGQLCDRSTCFTCNSTRESQAHTVRGTLLIPCRTAMRGSFPLNGTYFQVNEVFADHHSSRNPIDIPRDWIWNLPRRTVCFGTSIPTIFRGLTTEGIQQCFWRGFVCVRGFDRVTRAPKPLYARLHFPASKAPKIRKGVVTQAAATTAKEDE